MATTRKTQFSDLPSELRSMIWNHAFNTSSQIQTLSIFDTRLYERDNRKNTIASSSSSPTVSPLIPVKSHWSIVSVPKRSLPTALLTCRETWAFSSNFLAGCRESHELLNPASITILQANPEKFYQKTIYSPIPKTTEKKQNFLIKPNEIVHFRPFEQKIRSDSGHTLEITGQDRAMKFFGIKYLAISYTDLYYFKHATPNTVKFHNLQILFVLKPTYQEREDNPCSEDEFEYALRYANTRALRYTTIYPVWQMELDELPLRIIRVDSLEAAGRAVRCINKLEATGWEMSRSVFCVAYKGGPGVSALPYDGPVLGRRTVDYEVNLWRGCGDGVGVQEMVDWDEREGFGGIDVVRMLASMRNSRRSWVDDDDEGIVRSGDFFEALDEVDGLGGLDDEDEDDHDHNYLDVLGELDELDGLDYLDE